MATKDWKKVINESRWVKGSLPKKQVVTISDSQYYPCGISYPRVNIYSNTKLIKSIMLKTKTEALNKAKAYMRSH
jgi:hypothetical protein